MVQKFVMYAPLYRQEQEWNRAGVQVEPADHEQLVLRVAEDWLKPVYEELHRRLLQRQVLHADETTLQVLKLEGRAARSKCYMWLYRTSGDAKSPLCCMSTGLPGRRRTRLPFWRVSPGGSMQMATPVTTGCLKTSGWLVAGRTCGENSMRRWMPCRRTNAQVVRHRRGWIMPLRD